MSSRVARALNIEKNGRESTSKRRTMEPLPNSPKEVLMEGREKATASGGMSVSKDEMALRPLKKTYSESAQGSGGTRGRISDELLKEC